MVASLGNASHVKVVLVDSARGQAYRALEQGMATFQAERGRGRDANDPLRPQLMGPVLIEEYTVEAVCRGLGDVPGVVVIVVDEAPWSIGGVDQTPGGSDHTDRHLCPSVQLAYDLVEQHGARVNVVLAVDPTRTNMYGMEEDPQYTAVCILAWMRSGIAAVVDRYYLNLPSVVRILADIGRPPARSWQRMPLVGSAAKKMAPLKESCFARNGIPKHPAFGRVEPARRGMFRTALALAQFPILPIRKGVRKGATGESETIRRSSSLRTLAARMNSLAKYSGFRHHVGGLDDLISRLEREWCTEDEDAGVYSRSVNRPSLSRYARRQGGFPRRLPLTRGVAVESLGDVLFQTLEDVDYITHEYSDGVLHAWYSRPQS